MSAFKQDTLLKSLISLDELVIYNAPLLLVDTISSNRNVYPEDEVIRMIEVYKAITNKVEPTYRYMLIRHPKIIDENKEVNGLTLDISDISYEKVAGWLEDIWYDEKDKVVYGNVKVLNTENGLIIRYLYEKGYPIGFSVRLSFSSVETKMDDDGNPYYVKRGLVLHGFDFVINPSFVFTWIRKDVSGIHAMQGKISNVEQKAIVDDLVNMYKISVEQAQNIYKVMENLYKEFINASQENNTDKLFQHVSSIIRKNDENVEKMQKNNTVMEFNVNNLELEKLAIKKEKLELEIEKLEKEYERKLKEYSSIEKEIEELQSRKSEILGKIENSNIELEFLISKITRYREKLEELERKIAELQELKKSLEVVVKHGDKEFSLENPPKIRIVPVEEKVSYTGWGKIDKNKLRKLIYLSQDKEVIEECFALVRDYENLEEYKYPHHELIESEDENYDFDLVLNVNGLRTAYIFVNGFAGRHLSPDEKEKILNHLKKHYKELKENDIIDKLPASLESKNSIFKFDVDYNGLDEITPEDAIIFESIENVLRVAVENRKLVVSEDIMEKGFVYTINNDTIQDVYNLIMESIIASIKESLNVEENENEDNISVEQVNPYINDKVRKEYTLDDLVRIVEKYQREKDDVEEIDENELRRKIAIGIKNNDIDVMLLIYNAILYDILGELEEDEIVNMNALLDDIKESIIKTIKKLVLELQNEDFEIINEDELKEVNEMIENLKLNPKLNKNVEKVREEEEEEVMNEKLEEQDMEEREEEAGEERTMDERDEMIAKLIQENIINKALLRLALAGYKEEDLNRFIDMVDEAFKDVNEIDVKEYEAKINKLLERFMKENTASDNEVNPVAEDELEMESKRKGKFNIESKVANYRKTDDRIRKILELMLE
ncbi:MAG: hypothetical protein QXX12_01930, partial [Nanopusillaceae archaeon]